MTYTVGKILDIMKNYHVYKGNLQIDAKRYASVGVAQYGIEASLPKAQGGNSDVVATEALRGMDELPMFALMRTDVKYIDDRLYRVTDEADIEILGLRLEGQTIRDIGAITGFSKSKVHRRLVNIAKIIQCGTD